MNWFVIPRFTYGPICFNRLGCGHSYADFIEPVYGFAWCQECNEWGDITGSASYYWATPTTIKAIR